MRNVNSPSKNNNQINLKTFFTLHKTKIILVTVAVLFLVGIVRGRATSSASDTELLGSPIELSHQLDLRAKNKDGATVIQTVHVNLTGSQRQQRVLVKGKWLRAREGKMFLVVNMDVRNNLNVPVYAEPIDWLRLKRSDDKLVAPVAHQGLIEVRPLSTKETNVGFVVDEGEKKFTLELGMVDGIPQTIEMEF